MDFRDIIDKASVTCEFKASNKNDALSKLAELACESEKTRGIGADYIYEKLKEREEEGTTGFGNEIAIPHAAIDGMNEFLLVIAVAHRGIHFESTDNKKVKIFFVILGPPDMPDMHIKILATISRSLIHTRVVHEMIQAKRPGAIVESFLKSISPLEDKGKTEKTKMKLMFIILYTEDYLYDILELFLQEGVQGATVNESFGIGEYIYNIPIFAHFISFMNENRNRSKTIMAMVPESDVAHLVEGIEEITGNLDKKEGAMIFTLDVDFYKGTMEMM